MKVKNLIENLQKYDLEANIYFKLDLSSKEGYPMLQIHEESRYQLVGIILK